MGIIAGILGASAIGGGASILGASDQANAANNAAALEANEQSQALAFEKQVYGQQQSEEQPFIQAGTSALGTLQGLLSPGGQLTQQFGQFSAPTLTQAEQEPGYQFALQQGQQALQAGAAAQGNLLSSGTQKGLVNYGQQAAQTDYQQVYNNALAGYQQNFNTFNTNQANLYNRYAGIAGIGQQAAGTAGSLGGQAASTTANTLLTGGAQQAQALQNSAAATASGYVGAGNAVSGGLSNLGGLLSLQNLLSPQNNSAVNNAAAGAGATLANVGGV